MPRTPTEITTRIAAFVAWYDAMPEDAPVPDHVHDDLARVQDMMVAALEEAIGDSNEAASESIAFLLEEGAVAPLSHSESWLAVAEMLRE